MHTPHSAKHGRNSTVQCTLSIVQFHVGFQSGLVLWIEGMTGVSTHIGAYHLEKAGYGPEKNNAANS